MAVNNYIDTITIVRSGLDRHQGPRYKAIADALSDAILQVRIDPGAKLPPLRILADALSVTVGTIKRAYSECGKTQPRDIAGRGWYLRQ